MATLRAQFVKLWKDEDGLTAVEYSVLVALVIVACLVTIGVLGGDANGVFSFWPAEAPAN